MGPGRRRHWQRPVSTPKSPPRMPNSPPKTCRSSGRFCQTGTGQLCRLATIDERKRPVNKTVKTILWDCKFQHFSSGQVRIDPSNDPTEQTMRNRYCWLHDIGDPRLCTAASLIEALAVRGLEIPVERIGAIEKARKPESISNLVIPSQDPAVTSMSLAFSMLGRDSTRWTLRAVSRVLPRGLTCISKG